MTNKPFIIGITGGSGSGKTSILREITKTFPDGQVCIISQDDYYKPREQQKRDKNGIKNFDLPESVELEELYTDLQRLIRGEPVERIEYTFNNSLRSPSMKKIKPASVIFVEGLFVNIHEGMRERFDLNIFVNAADHLKIIRRIARDKEERNYPLSDVLYRYQHHVQPAYNKYVLPFKDKADIVINNNKDFNRGLNVLKGFIRSHLAAIPACEKD